MRALSLTQPWASLVALGVKKIETRGFPTSHRGPLAIHATREKPRWSDDAEVRAAIDAALAHHGYETSAGLLRPSDLLLPRSAVLATCVLAACVSTDGDVSEALAHSEPAEPLFGDWSPGRWLWLLADVVRFPRPVLCRGALGLWEWDGVSRAPSPGKRRTKAAPSLIPEAT